MKLTTISALETTTLLQTFLNLDTTDPQGATAALTFLKQQLQPALKRDLETLASHNSAVESTLIEVASYAAEKSGLKQTAKDATDMKTGVAALLKDINPTTIAKLASDYNFDITSLNVLYAAATGVNANASQPAAQPNAPSTAAPASAAPATPPTPANTAPNTVPTPATVPDNGTPAAVLALQMQIESMRKEHQLIQDSIKRQKEEMDLQGKTAYLRQLLTTGFTTPEGVKMVAADGVADFIIQQFSAQLPEYTESELTADVSQNLGLPPGVNKIYTSKDNKFLHAELCNFTKTPHGTVLFKVKTNTSGGNILSGVPQGSTVPVQQSQQNQPHTVTIDPITGAIVSSRVNNFDVKSIMKTPLGPKSGEIDLIKLQSQIVEGSMARDYQYVEFLQKLKDEVDYTMANNLRPVYEF